MIYQIHRYFCKKFKLLLSLYKTYAKMSLCVYYKRITNKGETFISNFPTIGLHFSFFEVFSLRVIPCWYLNCGGECHRPLIYMDMHGCISTSTTSSSSKYYSTWDGMMCKYKTEEVLTVEYSTVCMKPAYAQSRVISTESTIIKPYPRKSSERTGVAR
jgi:hypothetical protein